MLHHRSSLIFAAAFLFASSIALAAEPATRPSDAAKLKLTTDRLVVFKDGYALIIKSGTGVADADGHVWTDHVPDAAVLGTFWALGDGQKLVGMRSEWNDGRQVVQKTTPCISVPELLRANIGKRVTLGLPEKRNVTGVLVEMLDLPAAPLPVAVGAGFTLDGDEARMPVESLVAARDMLTAAATASGRSAPETTSIKRELTPRGGEFVVIDETETGRLVLPVSQVQTISGRDLATKMTRQEEIFTRQKNLSFDFGAASANKPVALKLYYFTSGIRWVPTYRIGGDLKDKADIALQGEVINDVEDVDKAALDLVVGVPNFRFKDSLSPLTLERYLRSTLTAAGPSAGANNDFSNFLSNSAQVAGAYRGRPVETTAAPSLAPELAGAGGEQDLFLYSISGFSLRKGARATVPLWQNSAPMRHVYTFDIRAARSRAGGMADARSMPGRSGSPLKVKINNIWHQLELTNNSTMPWTTGAALTMRQNLPIGQDMITYTPAGGCALLPLTVAVDILGTVEEEEVGRKANAIRVDQSDYTLIHKKGTISITNFRKEKSNVRISLATGGKVDEASDDGKIRINDFQAGDWQEAGYHNVNNHSDVSWDITLDAGQTKTITYSVNFYVR